MSEETTQDPVHIRTIFNSMKVEKMFEGASRTKSEFAEEANINNIVRRANISGVLPQGQRQALFGDFSEVQTYEEAQTQISEANESFLHLSAEVRAKFNNNVADLLDFIDDPANKEEAITLGLLQPETPTISSANEVLEEPISTENNE